MWAICLLAPALLGAGGGDASGRAVLDRLQQLDDTVRAWSDRSQQVVITVREADGETRYRELKEFAKRYPKDEDKSISFFSAPVEVRGVGFLQWEYQERDNDQWLYLPNFRRTRQIGNKNRDESFMGTDFSYRDLDILTKVTEWSEAEAATKLIGEEEMDGRKCTIIDSFPRREDIPYRRLRLWIDGESLLLRKVALFDEQDKEVKTVVREEFREVSSVPTAFRTEMLAHVKRSHTVVEIKEVTYNSGLADDLFTKRYLERGAP